MSALTWDAGTLATGGQLLMAATIAVHLLVVRPRAARENLALSARIIGDDVTLDQNHGLLPIRDPEVERVRQLVARVVQDPTTAKNVLLGAEAELAADPGRLLEERHREAALGRGRGGGEAGRAGTDLSRHDASQHHDHQRSRQR